MNSEAVVGVDQYGSSHLFQDVQLRPYFVVNVVIAALCGLSTVTSLISLFAKKNWIADEFHRSIQIQDHFRSITMLVSLGTVCSLIGFVISVLRIRCEPVKQSRQCRTAQFFNIIISFVSLLSSVTIWADFIRHTPVDQLCRYQIFIVTSTTQTQAQSNYTTRDLSWPTQFAHDHKRTSRPHSLVTRRGSGIGHPHSHSRITLGWAYWVCVTAVILSFIISLVYLMRKDCEPPKAE
ncbi:hypothetical protein FBUS_07544 [Fasciolopsis buskii]|uniref:Uncharacterized protein n=1 Tax=Fasciolopsis buskii TaxID=27845 RepID=A0A8E0S1N7_9TREM|nr:hypothetical protein FBUS_07544 [Fasciolopsis buski]